MIDKLALQNKALEIINKYYQIDHNFIYKDIWFGYSGSQVGFICTKCKYTIDIRFWTDVYFLNDDDIKFSAVENYINNSMYEYTTLNYYGDSGIFNNDKVEIVNCNEWMIKKILE